MPIIHNRESLIFSPEAVTDNAYSFCGTVLEDFITPYGFLVPITAVCFQIKDWLMTGYYLDHHGVAADSCLLLTRHNRLYHFRVDTKHGMPSIRAFRDTIRTQVYFTLDTQTWGEHAIAINALAHDLGLDEQATIELALSSLGKVGVPVERLQTFSRKELVAKVQEMYPNDEEGSVGDLQAFIVDALTKQQKMKKFYEE
jgi:hypothetical protein